MEDSILIGAGAAGLSAALELRRLGLRFTLLEARSEIGGRVRSGKTLRGEELRSETELGAEFIHGRAPLTKSLLSELGLGWEELDPDFHVFSDGRIHPAPGYWSILARSFRRLRKRKRDRPFSEFLSEAKLSDRERFLASSFVEGFEAAELDRIGSNALVGLGRTLGDPAERSIARPIGGYSRLLQALASEVSDSIRLRTAATEIEWSPGSVNVVSEGIDGRRVHSARSVLVTVPIGVLRAPSEAIGAIRFSPEIPGLGSALRKIEMGDVVRVTLEFTAEAEGLFSAKFRRPFPFVSSPELEFMTWWGGGLSRFPEITAWSGGDHALRFSGRTRSERIEIALENLARILGVRRSTLVYALRSVHHHDWRSDPFSRGAYSYPGLDSSSGVARLRRPTEKTVFFAGEALSSEESGTVESAIESGRSQAGKIAVALGARPGRWGRSVRRPISAAGSRSWSCDGGP